MISLGLLVIVGTIIGIPILALVIWLSIGGKSGRQDE